MEDFFEAGGLPAVIREFGERGLLHKDAMTVNGKTLWQNNCDAQCPEYFRGSAPLQLRTCVLRPISGQVSALVEHFSDVDVTKSQR